LRWEVKENLSRKSSLSFSTEYYVPPESEFNMLFVKDVLCGRKLVKIQYVSFLTTFLNKLRRNHEITEIAVPYFEEFIMRDMWDQAQDIPYLRRHFPNYSERRLPNREFFFKVISLHLTSIASFFRFSIACTQQNSESS
jgi:hypothetical protein